MAHISNRHKSDITTTLVIQRVEQKRSNWPSAKVEQSNGQAKNKAAD